MLHIRLCANKNLLLNAKTLQGGTSLAVNTLQLKMKSYRKIMQTGCMLSEENKLYSKKSTPGNELHKGHGNWLDIMQNEWQSKITQWVSGIMDGRKCKTATHRQRTDNVLDWCTASIQDLWATMQEMQQTSTGVNGYCNPINYLQCSKYRLNSTVTDQSA